MLIVFLPFLKEVSFNRYLEDKRMLTDSQQQVQNLLCCELLSNTNFCFKFEA
jgi:hypothetical protein